MCWSDCLAAMRSKIFAIAWPFGSELSSGASLLRFNLFLRNCIKLSVSDCMASGNSSGLSSIFCVKSFVV